IGHGNDDRDVPDSGARAIGALLGALAERVGEPDEVTGTALPKPEHPFAVCSDQPRLEYTTGYRDEHGIGGQRVGAAPRAAAGARPWIRNPGRQPLSHRWLRARRRWWY